MGVEGVKKKKKKIEGGEGGVSTAFANLQVIFIHICSKKKKVQNGLNASPFYKDF